MKVLNDFNYESSNGSETFYDYFYNKVGIGADPNAPFTKFLELIIDVFYNNVYEFSNIIYDGVLNPKTGRALEDDKLRTNWLNKLGSDLNLPNKGHMLDQYGYVKEELDNDQYAYYLYLSQCRFRTCQDFIVHFDKCFLNEENTDIESRITMVDDYAQKIHTVRLNRSSADSGDDFNFMQAMLKYVMQKNVIWENGVHK